MADFSDATVNRINETVAEFEADFPYIHFLDIAVLDEGEGHQASWTGKTYAQILGGDWMRIVWRAKKGLPRGHGQLGKHEIETMYFEREWRTKKAIYMSLAAFAFGEGWPQIVDSGGRYSSAELKRAYNEEVERVRARPYGR